jgi:fermentation-respiration switch protein FrsA (DUF1100 family)
MKLRKMVMVIILTVVLAYLVLVVLIYFGQSRLVFFPNRALITTPDRVGLNYVDVTIPVTPKENLNAWYFPADRPGDSIPTVLYCHENAGNISYGMETVRSFLQLGANVLAFDYRGYGRSDGRPSEQNVYEDAQAAWHWLVAVKQTAPDNIFIFGRSLGGAVAIDLATRVNCAGVILESTFTSAVDLGRKLYPFVPVRLVSRFSFDSLSKISLVSCPVMVAHSPADEMIPYAMGKALYEAARSERSFIDLAGYHNDLLSLDSDMYRNALRRFLWRSNTTSETESSSNE